MVGTRVGIGKVAINAVPMSTSQDIISMVGIDERRWNKKYLCHFIASKNEYLNSQARGATIRGIKIGVLSELKLPDISLSEQHRVSTVIDKVSDLITLRKQQLAKLDELVKARFVEMFGDSVINDKQFCTIIGCNYFKLSNGKAVPEYRRFSTGTPVYGGNGISWYTDEVLCEQDTIVVGRVGFQSGNVHLVNGPLWISDNAMYISEFLVTEYDLTFLCALMEHIDFTRYQDAGDLKKITQKPFMQMEFISPPLEQQHEYSSFAAQINKIKLTVQQGLDKLEMMKKALMQEYFG